MSETRSFSSAAVVAPHPAAAVAARDVLIEGGNAIEAVVAAAAVAAVACPERAGLLGDGLWLVREPGRAGRTRVLDARGPAATGATLALYRRDEAERIPARGPGAVLTVPGTVAGWRAALDLSAVLGGRLPAGRLLDPAIALARGGVPASRPGLAQADAEALAVQPGFADAFLDDGRWPAAGTLRPSPRLADTLAYLAHAGLADAARGDVAREMAADLGELGAPLERADIRNFEARWREPLSIAAGRRRIETAPTRAGLGLLLSLALFGRLAPFRPGSADEASRLTAVQARAAALVAACLDEGRDPATLLNPAALDAEAAASLARGGPLPIPPFLPGEAGAFIGAIDARGLAVSLVVSMGLPFGSGVVLPRTGLLTNDRGAAFALWSGAGPVLRPGRRPPLDALPLVAAGHDGMVAALGLAGAVAPLAAMVRGLDGDPFAAVAAPRLRPGRDPDGAAVWLAEEGIESDMTAALRRSNQAVLDGRGDFGEGGLLRRRSDGRIEVAADPRAEAEADGL